MDWTLEVVILPVSDIDRSVAFYRDQVGFHLDHDTTNEFMHVVQLTPTGSGCSIVIGDLPTQREMAPGSMRGLQLVVADAAAARQELLDRGVEASEIMVFDERDGGTFFGFSDPDGNTWSRPAAQGPRREAVDPARPPRAVRRGRRGLGGVHAPDAHVLADPEAAGRESDDRGQLRVGDLEREDLGAVDGDRAARPPDAAAAGRQDVLGPLGRLAEGHRDQIAVGSSQGHDRDLIGRSGRAARCVRGRPTRGTIGCRRAGVTSIRSGSRGDARGWGPSGSPREPRPRRGGESVSSCRR